MRWNRGQDVVNEYLASQHLEQLRGTDADGSILIEQAALTLRTARTAAESDPRNCVTLAYDAARSAAEGLLAQQGLRVKSTAGHHAVVGQIMDAQFGYGFGQFDSWRRRRNELSYATRYNTVSVGEAQDAIDDATDMDEAAQQLLSSGQLGIWTT